MPNRVSDIKWGVQRLQQQRYASSTSLPSVCRSNTMAGQLGDSTNILIHWSDCSDSSTIARCKFSASARKSECRVIRDTTTAEFGGNGIRRTADELDKLVMHCEHRSCVWMASSTRSPSSQSEQAARPRVPAAAHSRADLRMIASVVSEAALIASVLRISNSCSGFGATMVESCISLPTPTPSIGYLRGGRLSAKFRAAWQPLPIACVPEQREYI